MTIEHPYPWETSGAYDPSHPMHQALDRLVWEVLALRESFPLIVAEAGHRAATAEGLFDAVRPSQPLRVAELPPHCAPAVSQVPFVHASALALTSNAFVAQFGRSMLLSLVAAYDGFLGNLLRAQFKVSPDHLRNAHTQLLPRDILGLEPDAVVGLVVEREVARLLHDGRAAQLKALAGLARHGGQEGLLGPLLEEMTEIWERRNLCAHTGGRVSQHYLDACPAERARVSPGDQIELDESYFRRACETVIVAAVMLTQRIWRARARDAEAADTDVRHLAYRLLVLEDWALATRILEFAADVASGESARLVMVVNLAQAYRWQGDTVRCAEVLRRHNWGTLDPVFRLAHAVLTDDVAHAAVLMRNAIICGEVHRSAFDHWPLFRAFSTTPEFAGVYFEQFGEHCPRSSPQLDLLVDIPAQIDLTASADGSPAALAG